MEALGINLGLFLVQVGSFLIMLVVLGAWAYRPVVNMLKNRRETIAQGLEDARIAAEARANAEKEAESVLTKAQQEASQQVRHATDRAEEVAKEMRAEAEQDAARIRENAMIEAEQAKTQALGELRGQVSALAIAAAQKVIGEALDEKRQHKLIEEFFSGVKADKVVVLEGAELSGASADVISALPLTDKEQKTVRKDIIDKMGDSASISFRVDPSILGGLIIRVGDKVLDGSVAGKLDELRQNLR